jgi:CDP-paratose 2-epimerase
MSLALITGASGLVGSETAIFLLNKGFDVIGIDNNERKKLFGKDGDTLRIKKFLKTKYKKYKHFNVDIRNLSGLEKIFKKYDKNINFILHAAAQPSHDWAYRDIRRDFSINSLGTLNMLEFTKKYCPRATFIFTSTNKVYGNNPNKLDFIEAKTRWTLKKKSNFFRGIDETMSIDHCTHSLFGISKAYADLLVQEYNKNFGLKTACFRAGCITGPNHSGAKLHGFLSYLVKACIRDKKYQLIGYKGKQVRDNIHSFDLTNAFWSFYKKPIDNAVFNIGGSDYSNCSIIEAIEYVENKLDIKVKKKIISNARIGDHQWYISNIDKFKKFYPKYKLTYNTKKILDEIIDETLNY